MLSVMAPFAYRSIRMGEREWDRAKREAMDLGCPVGMYVTQVLRNFWQSGANLRILPPPVVDPWVPKKKPPGESSAQGPMPSYD